jgi:outer membrane lipoprotein carrier protein
MKKSHYLLLGIITPLLLSLFIPAYANGLDTLTTFLKDVQTGQADFTQTTGQLAEKKVYQGTFAFARPNRFRFDYQEPFQQTIVADGENVWLYDQGLNQVTVQPQTQALHNTPIAVVTGITTVQDLEQSFVVQEDGEQDGLDWVLLLPKSELQNTQFQRIRIGLTDNTLRILETTDWFNRRSVIRFSDFVISNIPVDFSFIPPPGVDMVR